MLYKKGKKIFRVIGGVYMESTLLELTQDPWVHGSDFMKLDTNNQNIANRCKSSYKQKPGILPNMFAKPQLNWAWHEITQADKNPNFFDQIRA